MIVKILKNVSGFPGVRYNTNKVDKNLGELLKVANFGTLQALTRLKPQDYINYLQMISGLNSNVRKPQFHAVISAKGRSYNKDELCNVAEKWLGQMGYAEQPYLIIYHKDTDNNHIHIVTTRVNKEGDKINSGYEKIRGRKALDHVLGYTVGMQYHFSTKAQFYMVLESFGFHGKDADNLKLDQKIAHYSPDRQRIAMIRDILSQKKVGDGVLPFLRDEFGLELIFHSAENKSPYGYTIIDHSNKTVFKGSEVMPLRQLMLSPDDRANKGVTAAQAPPVFVGPVRIANDIDDEAIHGRNRRRKKKARTNTR